MRLLLVTYVLNNPNKDYATFFDAINSNSSNWWHFLDHTWIVRTDKTADAFAKALYPTIVKNDLLLVIKISKEYQGWLPEEAWKWLNEQLF